jgi:hypothetical protein
MPLHLPPHSSQHARDRRLQTVRELKDRRDGSETGHFGHHPSVVREGRPNVVPRQQIRGREHEAHRRGEREDRAGRALRVGGAVSAQKLPDANGARDPERKRKAVGPEDKRKELLKAIHTKRADQNTQSGEGVAGAGKVVLFLRPEEDEAADVEKQDVRTQAV